jgi:hypothetical protein
MINQSYADDGGEMTSSTTVLAKPTESRIDGFQWDMVVGMVADAFRFTRQETKEFRSRGIPKLIAAIPFLAGCKDPLRTAISHLGTYILSVRLPKVAETGPSDDEYLLRRLEPINHFAGGDNEIVQRGMNLIALCMICDYERDVAEDSKLGKYNPVSAGALDFEEQRSDLIGQIESVQCDEMDAILPIEKCYSSFWLI